VNFEQMYAAHRWKPIINCSGRFVLQGNEATMQPTTLAQGLLEHEFRSESTQDLVIVVIFSDGGLISYRKAEGKFVHTLNTSAGFRRKLVDLGLYDEVIHSASKSRIETELIDPTFA
jgi:hypothetical protein